MELLDGGEGTAARQERRERGGGKGGGIGGGGGMHCFEGGVDVDKAQESGLSCGLSFVKEILFRLSCGMKWLQDGRLEDKSAFVRKPALQLLIAMCIL